MGTLQTFSCQGQIPTNALVHFLKENQDLENVTIACYRLSYFDLGKTVGTTLQIAQTLAALPKIKTLNLQFDLSPEETEALIVGLKDNKTITELGIDQYWLVHDFRSSVSNKIAALLSLKYALLNFKHNKLTHYCRSLHTLRMTNFKGLTYFTGTKIELLDFSPLFKMTGTIKTLDCYFAPFDTSKLFQVIEQGTCLEQIILQHDENISFARDLFEVCRRRNPFIMIVTKGLRFTPERSALKKARVNLFSRLLTFRVLLLAGTKEPVLLTQLPPEILLMVLAHIVSPVEISHAQCAGLLGSLANKNFSIRECWSRSFFFAASVNCGPLSSVGRALGF